VFPIGSVLAVTYLYPDSFQAAEQWPVALKLLQGQAPDVPVGCKAGYVVAGYGLSLYPGEPGTFGAEAVAVESPANYGEADMIRDLDEHFGEVEKFAASGSEELPAAVAKALPWNIIVPLLMAAIQKAIEKWLAKKG